MASRADEDENEHQDDVDAVLHASRALVGIAARSLQLPDDVTLAQYRALVLLAGRGQQPIGELAAGLAIHPSTATRLVDRLVAKELVERVAPGEATDDRRHTPVRLAPSGARLVAGVTSRRRRELGAVLARLDAKARAQLQVSMTTFAEAAGEIADASWELGWELE
jgi:DNA-binding MarR family transcriptional regulator